MFTKFLLWIIIIVFFFAVSAFLIYLAWQITGEGHQEGSSEAEDMLDFGGAMLVLMLGGSSALFLIIIPFIKGIKKFN